MYQTVMNQILVSVVGCVQSVLSEAASKKMYKVHIAPKYLIPDTNCYVDLLPSIKRLVDTSHFTIAVPLTGTSLLCSIIMFFTFSFHLDLIFLVFCLAIQFKLCKNHFFLSG